MKKFGEFWFSFKHSRKECNVERGPEAFVRVDDSKERKEVGEHWQWKTQTRQ